MAVRNERLSMPTKTRLRVRLLTGAPRLPTHAFGRGPWPSRARAVTWRASLVPLAAAQLLPVPAAPRAGRRSRETSAAADASEGVEHEWFAATAAAQGRAAAAGRRSRSRE